MSYAEEAALYRRLFEVHCQRPLRTLLDLGSGGGERSLQYLVHVEKGKTYWGEYFFNGELYGKQ
jgi:hypothetical protein